MNNGSCSCTKLKDLSMQELIRYAFINTQINGKMHITAA